jgi:PAS domain S-box-containing protein/putative nucleotidyltransferase with HDIG domain
MALVHEQLYRAREYAKIDFSTYIDQLASTLFNMYQVEHEQIQLKIEAEGAYLDLEKAIPCGLLLKERYSASNFRCSLGMRKDCMDKTNILVVEDSGIVLLDIQKTLNSLGYTVVATASSKEEAIRKVDETRPDLVLMDIRLGEGMGGIDAADHIREHFNIPVVFLTGYADDDTFQRAKITDPFGYILKPFDPKGLRTTIEIALHNHELKSKLRESERRYRTLVEAMNDGVGQVDAEGKVIFVNDKLCQMTGYSREELLGRDHTTLFTDEFRQLHLEEFTKRETGAAGSFETSLACKDGSYLSVILSGKPVFDEGGKFAGSIGVFTDITARKQAEGELKKNKQALEEAERLVHLGHYEIDATTGNAIWSEEIFNIFGLDPGIGEPTFETYQQLVHPDDRVKVYGLFEDSVQNGTQFDFVYRIIRSDGKIRYVHSNARAVKDESGNTVKLFGTFQDVTQLKQVEQELQEYAARLESLREVSLEITSQLNLDTLLHFIAEKAIELLGGSQGGFYIYRPKRNLLEWVVGVNSLVPVGTTLRRGEGLAGRVWENDAPMIVDDYQRWEGRAGIFEGFEFGATIEAPMYWKSANGEDEFLGVLNISRKSAFSDSDTDLLSLFATQAAIAIHNAQLYDLAQLEIHERARAEVALRRRAEELAALQETVLEITLPHSLDELLKSIVERAVNLIGASGGGLYLADSELRQVRCVVSYNTQHDYTGVVLAYGEGVAGYVAQTGKPLRTDDYSSWWGRADIYEDDQPFHAVISTPLLWQGQVTGVLHLLRNISQKFTQEDLNLLTLFANHASVTVENARLYISLAKELVEREQAEQAVQESERKYRSIVESSTFGIHLYELQSPDCLIFVGSNPAADTILGLDHSKFVGRTLEDAFPGLVDTEVPMHYKEAAAKGIPWRTDQFGYGSNIFEIVAFQISQNKMVVMFQDVTARRQAEEALRSKTAELEALFSISSHLRMAQSADAMLPLVLSEMRRVLRSDANAVILLYQDEAHFRYALSDGPLTVNNGAQFDVEKSISGLILQTHQAYITDDLSSDPQKTTTLQGDDGLGPAVFVPVISESEFIGVLVCARNKGIDAQSYSVSEVRLLTAIGEMVGNALRRARLYDQAMTRLQHVQTLHSIDMAISANLDLSVILDVLLTQGTVQLNVDAACILLLNPHTHMLEYAAGNGFTAKAIKAARLRLGEGLPGRAAIDRKILHVSDLSKCDDLVRRYLLEEGFISYQASPLIAKGQLQGVLEIFNRKPMSGNGEQMGFLETLATQAAIAIENSQLFSDLQRSNFELEMAYDATIEGWSRALELRDQETEGHTLRVADMTIQLAQAMGVHGGELPHIRRGALLHDIGKMGVPDRILLKPGKLTAEEWETMRQHTTYAFEMLWPIEFLRPAIDIPHCHHERWDGTGYPRQLEGEQIPLSARLFAVADVWDALTSDRPYRKAWTKEKALDYITTNAGKHFDPRVVETFLVLRNEIAQS